MIIHKRISNLISQEKGGGAAGLDFDFSLCHFCILATIAIQSIYLLRLLNFKGPGGRLKDKRRLKERGDCSNTVTW